MAAEVNPTNLTAEAESRAGKFEPDPNDPLVIRYIPSETEMDKINKFVGDEIERAWTDDQVSRNKCLELLREYKAVADDAKQPVKIPLMKRAVRQNVAWTKRTIMSRHPLVTVTPDSNKSVTVLVNDETFGPVPMEKTSEEVAQALEYWLEYKLRKRIPFSDVVRTACMEAKRGQTPTYIKIFRDETKTISRQPKFGKKGPISIVFEGKEDTEQTRSATRMENVSRYATLLPADEQDIQKSRLFWEYMPESSDDLREHLTNGIYYLIDEKIEDFIKDGAQNEPLPDERQRSAMEKRVPSLPPDYHEIWLTYLFWTVPTKQTLTVMSKDGETKEKTITVHKKYSFVGPFHRKKKKMMSMIRLPYDHGMRPYIPVVDSAEPFRYNGESLAEDVLPYQKQYSWLNSLEIRGGVIATTPVFYYEPGSVAGDWLMETGDVQPGDFVPRQRETEIEGKVLAERPVSLLGLIEHVQSEYERQFQIGDLTLGIDLPGRTPASTLSQVLSQGETQASEFLDTFREALGRAIKMYVQTEQQYMRFGEDIPFDDETRATIEAALSQDGGQPTQQDLNAAVRFPVKPIGDEFGFNITASSDDRQQQADFEKIVSIKKLVDADSAGVAQMLVALASGKLPAEVSDLLVDDFKRREFLMELLAKTMRKDGKKFALDSKKLSVMIEKQRVAAQMAEQQPPEGAPNGPQGAGVGGSQGAMPGGGNEQGAMGGMVSPPGNAASPQQGQGAIPS